LSPWKCKLEIGLVICLKQKRVVVILIRGEVASLQFSPEVEAVDALSEIASFCYGLA
jgi:hypothetical protein